MNELSPEALAALSAEDQGPLCERIVVAFTTLAFVSVCFRLFARIRYHKTGWEDWTIVVSMIASIGTCVFQILQVRAGNGKHGIFVSYPDEVTQVLKWLYFSIITYNISLTVTKISILLQYYRIFTLREMRIPVYVALVIVSAWGTTTLFTSIFSCVPIDAYWNVAAPKGAKCIHRTAVWYINASVNILTDLLVAIIPVRGIWSLQIPRRQKTALLGILTIGWFVCIVSGLRVYALHVFQQHPDDTTYYSAPTAYWSCIEANLAIVCASLPALKPLIVSVVPIFGTRGSTRGRGSTAASANSHRLNKLGAKGIWRSDDDKEKLTTDSSASHALSAAERGEESERLGRGNIYVTKQFSQHVEDGNCKGMEGGSQLELSMAEFLARGGGR